MNLFVSVVEFLTTYLPHANAIGTVLMVVVIIPLSFFRRPAVVTIPSGYLLTFLFGFSLWFYSVVIVFSSLGLFWALVCLFLVVGVIPVAFGCLLWQGEWAWLFSMLALLASVVVFRALLIWQAARLDRRENAAST